MKKGIGQKKGATSEKVTPCYFKQKQFYHYFLCFSSEDTDSFFLPLALLLARTFLPLAVAIRSLKPCLFFLFLFDG